MQLSPCDYSLVQALSQDMMSNAQKLKDRLTEVREDFQRAEGDTGSSEVQGLRDSQIYLLNVDTREFC